MGTEDEAGTMDGTDRARFQRRARRAAKAIRGLDERMHPQDQRLMS